MIHVLYAKLVYLSRSDKKLFASSKAFDFSMVAFSRNQLSGRYLSALVF